MIDKQRDQIRARDRELSQKTAEIENVNWYLCMQFGDFHNNQKIFLIPLVKCLDIIE